MIPEVEWEVLRFLPRPELDKCQVVFKLLQKIVDSIYSMLALIHIRHVDIYEASAKDSSSYFYIKFMPAFMQRPYVAKLSSVSLKSNPNQLVNALLRMRNAFVDKLELRVDSPQFFSQWAAICDTLPCSAKRVDLSRCQSSDVVDFVTERFGVSEYQFYVHREVSTQLDEILRKSEVSNAEELSLSFQLSWCPIWDGLEDYAFSNSTLSSLRLKFLNGDNKGIEWVDSFLRRFQTCTKTSNVVRRIFVEMGEFKPGENDDATEPQWPTTLTETNRLTEDGAKAKELPPNAVTYALKNSHTKQRLTVSVWEERHAGFEKASLFSNMCCFISVN
jgi:hypothetical protein